MSSAIDGISPRAQDQSPAVGKASEVTARIAIVIQQVASSAQTQAKGAIEAVQVSCSTASMVEDTVNGMESILARVDLSAKKVKDMGERSKRLLP
jgi:methyl-accepting chemotaxis protein